MIPTSFSSNFFVSSHHLIKSFSLVFRRNTFCILPNRYSTLSNTFFNMTVPEPVSAATKLSGYEFWQKSLRGSRYIVAPMVDQSELAWRTLSRRYNSELCYTPMFHARMFSDKNNTTYREEQWSTNSEDRPLIVQFCANDPETLLKAAKMVEKDCDAVDLNLGCPQHIAKRGHYGSYLQDEWDLIYRMVNLLHRELSVPVTVKIRIFPDVSKTIEYAKMIESAGAQLLTVHGRLREQKGHKTGLADWDQIRAVKQALKIPVFANGNILYFEDVQRCLEYTGCDGVMSAEGNLYNPALFTGQHPHSWQIAEEYLAICRELNTKWPFARAHLFKIFHAALPVHTDLRSALGSARTYEEIEKIVGELKQRLLEDEKVMGDEWKEKWGKLDERGLKMLPHWVCQPYIRPALPPAKSEGEKAEKKNEIKPENKEEKAPGNGINGMLTSVVAVAEGVKVVVDDKPTSEAMDTTSPAKLNSVIENELTPEFPQQNEDIVDEETEQSLAGLKRTRSMRSLESVRGVLQASPKRKKQKLGTAENNSAAPNPNRVQRQQCAGCKRSVASPKCPRHRCKACCNTCEAHSLSAKKKRRQERKAAQAEAGKESSEPKKLLSWSRCVVM
ncbi:uncharacterized protein VTP21DRAFT_5611 [Calcarisporiella thermophila]|uniref:uncharacterized protein n=1 Tax=Calcarisporiella thermophila TaxID=911321 RepID=UPI00374238FD